MRQSAPSFDTGETIADLREFCEGVHFGGSLGLGFAVCSGG
jgi:hypothetical protein